MIPEQYETHYKLKPDRNLFFQCFSCSLHCIDCAMALVEAITSAQLLKN